ncbi:hypothetical protein C8R45DRAFT_936104 [Mycena sanguinolenta]|nr:hypothetical protein C8R45DRAFT_936104 [Mycena sanguinolenta]
MSTFVSKGAGVVLGARACSTSNFPSIPLSPPSSRVQPSHHPDIEQSTPAAARNPRGQALCVARKQQNADLLSSLRNPPLRQNCEWDCIVMSRARPEALKPAKPGPFRPGQARPDCRACAGSGLGLEDFQARPGPPSPGLGNIFCLTEI